MIVSTVIVYVTSKNGQNKGSSKLEQAVSLPEGFSPSYNIFKTEPNAVRTYVRISVPRGLNREALINNIKHAALETYKKHPSHVVTVLAFREGDEATNLYTAGMAQLEAKGEFTEVNPGHPSQDMEIKVELQENYFAPPIKPYPLDTLVTAITDTKASRMPRSWDDSEILFVRPQGAKARIRDVDINPTGSSDTVRYKVAVAQNGQELQGWVFAEDIRSDDAGTTSSL